MDAGEFTDQGCQARAVARLMFGRHLGFEVATTSLTLPLLEHEMMDVHLNRWQCTHLVGVIGAQRYQVAMATGTGAGLNEMDLASGGLRRSAVQNIISLTATRV
jgi:hypothetical protein